MKKITRLLAVFLLLAAFAVPALSESARIRTTAQDGSAGEVPVSVVHNAAGETFYWIDMTQLPQEVWADLASGILEVADDAGQTVLTRPLEGSSAGTVTDWPMPIADPADPANPDAEVSITNSVELRSPAATRAISGRSAVYRTAVRPVRRSLVFFGALCGPWPEALPGSCSASACSA